MVLAKLYLNARVYTGTPRDADARAAAEAVISSGSYSLDANFLPLNPACTDRVTDLPLPFGEGGSRSCFHFDKHDLA